MNIDHIIVHHIEKERDEKSTLNLREDELAVSPAAENLLEGISSTYDKRTGKAYGQFQSDSARYPFSDSLDTYLHDDTVGFAAFTRSSMENLQTHIDDADWATGGYVVFILYRLGTGKSTKQHLMVVMLNDRRGTAVDDNTLEISDVTHLVLDELHLAARIDITAWLAKKPKHLSFVKGRSGGATVSRYFREFLGCAEYVDARPQTRLLIGVTESYIEKQSLNKLEARDVKKTVYDHTLKAHADKKQVSLADISYAVDPQRPKAFLEHANSEEQKLNANFDPDRAVIKKFGRFFGSDDEVTIGFDANVLGNRVRYNKDKSLHITHLPEDLERQLDEAL